MEQSTVQMLQDVCVELANDEAAKHDIKFIKSNGVGTNQMHVSSLMFNEDIASKEAANRALKPYISALLQKFHDKKVNVHRIPKRRFGDDAVESTYNDSLSPDLRVTAFYDATEDFHMIRVDIMHD